MIGGRIVDVTGERTGCDRNMTCNMIEDRTEASQQIWQTKRRDRTGDRTEDRTGDRTGDRTEDRTVTIL